MNVVPFRAGVPDPQFAPLRVGMLVGSVATSGGGVGEAVRSLALSLRSQGITCEIFTLLEPGAEPRDFAGLAVRLAPVRGPRGFGYAPDLGPLLAERPIDVLHVHGLWMYLSVAARRWSALTGRPYIVSPHGMLDPWALANSAWKKRIAWQLYEKRHLRSASLIHALCRAERQAVENLHLPAPTVVIPNGVERPGAGGGSPPWAGRLPADARVMLFLGRVTPKKRVAELMRAWQGVGQGGEWHLAVVGPIDPGYRDELEAIVAGAGAGGRVHLLGPAYGEARSAAYANAHAFVLPSISEGLPMAVLEAFSHGLPALLTAECNLPEAFACGCAAELDMRPGRIERSLGAFLAMPREEHRRMGETARLLAGERFDWEHVAARFRMVYSDLVAGAVGR